MVKRLYIILLCLFICRISADASGIEKLHQRFNVGVEWGYISNIYQHYHYNYTDDFGSRVNSEGQSWDYKSNGFLEVLAGVNLGRRFSVDAGTGWLGIYESRNGIPLIVRTSFYTDGRDCDGMKFYAECMRMNSDTFKSKPSYILCAGGGRHLILDEYLSLDLSVAFQFASDHPRDVFDHQFMYRVPNENLRRSDCFYGGVRFSIGLNF